MREAIEKLKGVSIAEILKDGDLTLLLVSTYGRLWRCVPGMCTRKLRKYHSLVINKGLEKLSTVEKSKNYELKKGIVIYVAANHAHYSNANITDAVAEKILKADPKSASKFKKMPKPKAAPSGPKSKQEDVIAAIKASSAPKELEAFKADKRVKVAAALAKRVRELVASADEKKDNEILS